MLGAGVSVVVLLKYLVFDKVSGKFWFGSV